jgi:putative transposase
MRYPASEKLEIIRTVEAVASAGPATLAMLGIPVPPSIAGMTAGPRAGLTRLTRLRPILGLSGTASRTRSERTLSSSRSSMPDLTPRELAVKFTDEKQYFVSESSVYRILKAEDLITSPAHIVIKAADEFRDKTTRPNELWQTDFTYLKVIGWGWFYLSTILDDYSRYIIAWKLCTTMKAEDVTDTLELALQASGCDSATVVAQAKAAQRQRLVLHRRRSGRLWLEAKAWSMSAARPTTRRPRARSSDGTRP